MMHNKRRRTLDTGEPTHQPNNPDSSNNMALSPLVRGSSDLFFRDAFREADDVRGTYVERLLSDTSPPIRLTHSPSALLPRQFFTNFFPGGALVPGGAGPVARPSGSVAKIIAVDVIVSHLPPSFLFAVLPQSSRYVVVRVSMSK